MAYPIPRFQGIVIEKDGGWTFEFFVSMLGEDARELFSCNKIYPTKDEALKQLRITIEDSIKMLSEQIPHMGINPHTYIDMKTNSTRRWDKKDEQ